MSELGRSPPTSPTVLPDPTDAENVLYNPPRERLRALAADEERSTVFGAPAYLSEARSRSADRTRNAVDDTFDADDHRLIDEALERADTDHMICLDRRVGRHPDTAFTCRLYVPKSYARIGLTIATLLEPATPDADPDFLTVQIPNHEETAIRVLPEAGVTTVLGSDYAGEAKKSFLRLFMRRAKQRGGIGLHAGSKRVRLADGDVGQLFLGLSATGKSTLTAHSLWLDPPEQATMLQDDVCALLADGTVAGSEGEGLYVKTDSLSKDEQPAVYEAVRDESAVLENVVVDDDGSIDFADDTYTANGRAAIRRDRLSSADDAIDLDRVDQIFFITRHPLMPPVCRLDPTEAAAAFMCGESIETSAGDPDRAGEAVRVVGTNPFIIGSKGEEGNRFRSLVDALDVETFVLNTGTLGDGDVDVTVEDTVTLVREIARGTVTWERADASGYAVPADVPGLDVSRFALDEIVPRYRERIDTLREDRRAHLETFDELDEEIASGF